MLQKKEKERMISTKKIIRNSIFLTGLYFVTSIILGDMQYDRGVLVLLAFLGINFLTKYIIIKYPHVNEAIIYIGLQGVLGYGFMLFLMMGGHLMMFSLLIWFIAGGVFGTIMWLCCKDYSVTKVSKSIIK